MAALVKVFNTVLFISFLVHALAPPLIGAQILLPQAFFPNFLVDFKNQYIHYSGDYLMAEAPHFFIGLLWLELLLQWPLTLLNLYAIAAAKSWLHTTCLIYGVSVFSASAHINCHVAMTAELTGSQRASDTLLKIYLPFLGLGLFPTLRGLPRSTQVTATGHGVGRSIGSKRKAWRKEMS